MVASEMLSVYLLQVAVKMLVDQFLFRPSTSDVLLTHYSGDGRAGNTRTLIKNYWPVPKLPCR